MRDAVKGYLTLAAGFTEVTRQRATAAARALVSQGEATAEQAGQLVEELLSQSRQNREAVAALVRYEVDRTLGRLRLASNDEVATLVERVRALEDEVRDLRAVTGQPASTQGRRAAGQPAKKPAKKAAKKAAKAPGQPGKKAARSPGKKAVAPATPTAVETAARTTAERAADPAAGSA